MGKLFPKDSGDSITPRQKRRVRCPTSKYLKPGALAQLRNSKASMRKSFPDLGKKRVALFCTTKLDDVAIENKVAAHEKSPVILSPVDLLKQKPFMRTPKTPRADYGGSESRLESLPMELLVKVLCHLHHDQLSAVFKVSHRIRKAAVIARQFHFDYTTPDRSRQEMLRTRTPLPAENFPFVGKGDGKDIFIRSPHTPKAPRHGPRPPSRLKIADIKQTAAVLFQDPAFPPAPRCAVVSALSKPMCKSLASNRVLFYEDELCHAVAQNKLM
ncbi:F-box protein At4g35930 [Linum grandiflorum]